MLYDRALSHISGRGTCMCTCAVCVVCECAECERAGADAEGMVMMG